MAYAMQDTSTSPSSESAIQVDDAASPSRGSDESWRKFSRRCTMLGIGVSVAGHLAVFLLLLPAAGTIKPVEVAQRQPMAIRIQPALESPAQAAATEVPEPQPEPEIKRPDPDPRPEPPTPRRQASIALPKPVAKPQPTPTKTPPPPAATPQQSPAKAVAAPTKGTPASATASAMDNWEGQVIAELEAKRRYPAAALRQRLQDVIYMRLTVDRKGKVLESGVVNSKGHVSLDNAAKDLVARASPLPPLPDSTPGSTYTFTVPIDYFLR